MISPSSFDLQAVARRVIKHGARDFRRDRDPVLIGHMQRMVHPVEPTLNHGHGDRAAKRL